MPFIHVKSLPFKGRFDIQAVVEGVSKKFARDSGVGLEHVAVTWEFLMEGAYAVGGQASHHQPRVSHPILVDLLAPDFNDADTIAHMMRAVAHSIAVHTGVTVANVFVNYRQAHAGMVFDSGEVIRWSPTSRVHSGVAPLAPD
jgi:phenylpyruvate tautomerase PptA (4-oxalocrotonate tautomerase family)